MSSSVLEGLAKLCTKRRQLFAKHGGTYPPGATYVLQVLVANRWFSIVLFGEGPRPAEWDHSFDPTWSDIPPAEPLSGGKACLGTAVEGDGGACIGSIGWNVMFNGNDALVTSRHVVVSNYSSSTAPDLASVFSNPMGSAEIVWSPVMDYTSPATFDIAICKYIHGEGRRASNCGGEVGYPTSLAADLDAAADKFEFAGATTSCGQGSLLAVADVLVNYTKYKGGHIWMQNQLIFDVPCGKGDSGSAIKRVSDNAIAALNSAKSKKHGFAVANPLFLIDWNVTPGGQTDLPTVALRNPVPPGVPEWKAPQQLLECHDVDVLPIEDAVLTREDAIARLAWVQSLKK